MKKQLLYFYYGLLILVLSCQAMYTVYKLGGTVGQGEKISQLQQEQSQLEKNLNILEEKRADSLAITAVAQNTTGYTSIREPITLTTTQSVASR